MVGLLPSCLLYIMLISSASSFRTWTCTDNKCVKEETKTLENATSIEECKIKCLNFSGLWPAPTGTVNLSNNFLLLDVTRISFEQNKWSEAVTNLLRKAEARFLSQVKGSDVSADTYFGVRYGLNVKVEIHDQTATLFSTGTDEAYKLQISPPLDSDRVQASIVAETYFGVRHGLETLSQLIFFDDLRRIHKIVAEVNITDQPTFTHRGIILDTARSYISVKEIFKILHVMAMNKMNTFHWHITDSQSFPYVSLTYPELSATGAYSSDQVYTNNDIKQIVQEAQSLGIRVVPEFDAPAHVGEGWEALGSDLVTCFKWQPWREYCVEPPCGQFDPTNEQVYEILGNIFKEYVELFQSDLFHMGGDEVNINCWRSTPRIVEWMEKMNISQSTEGFHQLWSIYQEKALKKLKESKKDRHPQAVLWTSTLTQPNLIDDYLSPDDYVIQIWTEKTDESIKALIHKKFRVIFSNYDELYLDCGGPSWVGAAGHNWCSPFIGWQQVYYHSPFAILQNLGIDINATKELILGSEVAVWTEQIDDSNLHVRLWPRAAALAERLWSNPNDTWQNSQFRMNHHRHRMAKIIPTEVLQPQWCHQNDGFCD